MNWEVFWKEAVAT